MRTLKQFSVLAAAVFALSGIGAANALGAQFTASETGEAKGHAVSSQVFTTNGGTVKCTTAEKTIKISISISFEWSATANYGGCTAFGLVGAEVSPATFLLTANGEVHVKSTITVKVPLAGCSVTVEPQTLKGVSYDNESGTLKETDSIKGITYTSSGGLCGSSGSNGTYTGNNQLERVGGGSISWDA